MANKKKRLLKKDKRSQPREEGKSREPKASCFPHEVTKALNRLAWKEGKSVSWVIATMVYDYFGLDESGFHAKDETHRERKRA